MRKQKPVWRTVLVLAVAILIVVAGAWAGDRFLGLSGRLTTLFVPVQKGFTGMVSRVEGYFIEQARERQLQAEFNALSDRVTVLTIMASQTEELRRENQRLNELLGVMEQYPELRLKKAKVIAKGTGAFFSTFTMNLGEKDGMKPDMAIVAKGGLVGRITDVAPDSSTVLSIIDGRSSLGGVVERTRDNGMIHGSLNLTENDEACRMEYLPYETELILGDRILSSGLDGVYPKGLVIGEVKEIARENLSMQYVVIKPAVDFRHLEEVLVVLDDSAMGEENVGVEDSE